MDRGVDRGREGVDGQRMDGQRDGWMDRQVNGWTDRGMDQQRVGWMDRGEARQTDRQACCRMPTAQPGFDAVACPIPASCLLPQFPQLANTLRAEAAPPRLAPALGLPACWGGDPPPTGVPLSPVWGLRLNLAQGGAPWDLPRRLRGPVGGREGGTARSGPSATDGGSGTSPRQ